MAMFGKVQELITQVHPGSRLKKGLAVIQDYLEGRSPEIEKVVRSQKAGDKATIQIDGDALYVLIQCYQPKVREQGKFEAHQRHTDLQYIGEGKEWIDVCDLQAQRNLPAYDANGNIYFPLGTEACSRVLLNSGDVAVLFPNDAHAPCLRVEDGRDALVRKIVVKVKDAHLTVGQ